MNYMILSATNRCNLEINVEDALTDGWELVGGVAVVWDGEEKTYCQAMKRKI